MKILLLALFIILSWTVRRCTAGPGDPYDGYKVIEMVAKSNRTASMMKKFISKQDKDMEVWMQSPLQCQVQVPGNKMAVVKKYCEKWNITMTVKIENLKVAINKQIKDNQPLSKRILSKYSYYRTRFAEPFNYTKYNRFEDILKELYRLQCKYPHLIDIVQVGSSYEGRPLVLAKITQNVLSDCSDNKQVVWIDGGSHAREWISVASPMYMINELVTKFGKDRNISDLLKNNAVFIAPVVNPDGYEFTFTNDRLWRKSRTPNPGSECIGTDPNRNWNVMWGGAGSSNDPCSNLYRGTAPESEPVVKAYANVLRYLNDQKRIKFFLTLHSFSQVLLLPNSYTADPPADISKILPPAVEFFMTAQKLGKVYIFGSSPTILQQRVTGASFDYVHDSLGISFSYLLELRPPPSSSIGFLLPADQIAPTTQETFCGILAMLKKVDQMA